MKKKEKQTTLFPIVVEINISADTIMKKNTKEKK